MPFQSPPSGDGPSNAAMEASSSFKAAPIGETVERLSVEALHVVANPTTRVTQSVAGFGARPAHAHESNGLDSGAELGVRRHPGGFGELFGRQVRDQFKTR